MDVGVPLNFLDHLIFRGDLHLARKICPDLKEKAFFMKVAL